MPDFFLEKRGFPLNLSSFVSLGQVRLCLTDLIQNNYLANLLQDS